MMTANGAPLTRTSIGSSTATSSRSLVRSAPMRTSGTDRLAVVTRILSVDGFADFGDDGVGERGFEDEGCPPGGGRVTRGELGRMAGDGDDRDVPRVGIGFELTGRFPTVNAR